MGTHIEKLVFGFLGAITAVVVGLAVFGDFPTKSTRTPASEDPRSEPPLYYYSD